MTFKGKPCPTCGRPLPETAAEKLDRLVDRSGGPDACWPYTGRVNGHGYGVIDVWEEGQARQYRAHRFAYEQARGALPAGHGALHACDGRYAPGDVSYRRCCNPAHLFPGTRRENVAHMWAQGRQKSYAAMPEGEAVGTAKLTEAQVLELRRRFAAGGTAKGLAPEFGVSQAAAWNVIHGVTWDHLPGAAPRRGRGRRAP